MSQQPLSAEEFVYVETSKRSNNEVNSSPALSYRKEVFQFLIHNKIAVITSIILIFIVLGAIFIPMFSRIDYTTQNVAFASRGPMSYDANTQVMHYFGTDHLGRDIFVRLFYGARISLIVACVAALIDSVIGIVYGSIAGYMGGAVDNFMMRVLEIINGIPYLVIVLLLMAVLPQGIMTLIIAYCLVGWTGMARWVRGQVLSLVQQEFVIASKIMGAKLSKIILRHLIPNMMGLIIVNITLDIPSIIFTEAFLSMLGMGVPQPYPSLGVMVNEGASIFQTYPYRLIIPGVFLCLIMLAFNLLGDQMQDALNPKIRRRLGYGRTSKD